MTSKRKFQILAVLYALLSINIFSQNELAADKIFELVNNSVVVILAYDNSGSIFQGSGVVVSDDGLVATNFHVCKDAGRIEIKHYSNEYKNVEIIYSDEKKDILIIKVKNLTLASLKAAYISDLKAGQRVYAIGSPEGYENSISEGIISGFRTDENNVRLIQMTTPITEGSSGGAVVNSYGELIGLSMSGQHEGSLYFALPVSEISDYTGGKNITESEPPINYFESGTKASEKENYKEAEFYFSKYLDKFSNDVAAYYNRGYARFKLKEFKQAIQDFNKVLEYDNKDGRSYFYRANCYFRLKEYKSAVKDYSESIKIDPLDADVYYNRGYAYYGANEFSSALNDWEKAVTLNPEYEAELSNKISLLKEKLNSPK